jgi:(S)-mandelate dehydrogenase
MALNIEDHRRTARRVLPHFVFEYVDGAADDEVCLERNRRDLDQVTLTPRVLRDTSRIDTSIEVFGSTWSHPFAVAPTGLNGLVRPGGDALIAAAAASAGVPFTLSTASNQRLENVRLAAPSGEQWLQLYVMQDRSIAEQLVARAAAANYRALVLTVDVPLSGNRERDLRNGFKLPMRPTPGLAWDVISHPRWALRLASGGPPKFVNLVADPTAKLSAQAQAALLARSMDRTLVWDSLRWLRSIWKGPLLLKGLLHPIDAALALKHGVDGLIVSNHGGRQFDAAPSAISALPAMVDAVQGHVPMFMDSGVRRGTDVARALSLGARAVFVGRPVIYGLAGAGQAGVEDVLRLLGEEFERCMVLLGTARPADIGAIHRASELNTPP